MSIRSTGGPSIYRSTVPFYLNDVQTSWVKKGTNFGKTLSCVGCSSQVSESHHKVRDTAGPGPGVRTVRERT